MAYPSYPTFPGIGGLLVVVDPSFMVNAATTLYGTVTTAVPGLGGGAVILRPFGQFDAMGALLNTWIKPPSGAQPAVMFPLLWGCGQRGMIALAPGGGT